MPKQRTGFVTKKADGWYYGFAYTTAEGQRRQVLRKAENKTDAKNKLAGMLAEFEMHAPDAATPKTFRELADYYERTFIVEAVIRDGRKLAGLKDTKRVRQRLNILREHFKDILLKQITHGALASFRMQRLRTRTIRTKDENDPAQLRSVTTVQRELQLLHRILSIAERQGFIRLNPFKQGESLIRPADEAKRSVILSRKEEELLLAECDKGTTYLRSLVILALETGMRRGELLKLTWADVDLEEGIITVVASNTKTLQRRYVGLTTRAKVELLKIGEGLQRSSLGDKIFTVGDPRKAFDSARTKAGLKHVRFHDLRATAGTRMLEAGMNEALVAKMLGHTQINTLYRHYTRLTPETARQMARAMDSKLEDEPGRELVN